MGLPKQLKLPNVQQGYANFFISVKQVGEVQAEYIPGYRKEPNITKKRPTETTILIYLKFCSKRGCIIKSQFQDLKYELF